jgi:hypothetical protein
MKHNNEEIDNQSALIYWVAVFIVAIEVIVMYLYCG